LHGLASPEECVQLRNEASAMASAQRQLSEDASQRRRSSLFSRYLRDPIDRCMSGIGSSFELVRVLTSVPEAQDAEGDGVIPGRVRLPVVTMLGGAGQDLCDRLLHRAVERIDVAPLLHQLLPSLFAECFEGSRSFYSNRRIGYTHGEPAINVYTTGGRFHPHTDKQSLTVLVPLSESSEFSGGGTSFWRQGQQETHREKLEHARHTTPALTLMPPAGTALLFGGSVMHAGGVVTDGERVVFVASFSRSSERNGTPDYAAHVVAATPGAAASIWLSGALEGLDQAF
jgi:hypothetical protein